MRCKATLHEGGKVRATSPTGAIQAGTVTMSLFSLSASITASATVPAVTAGSK